MDSGSLRVAAAFVRVRGRDRLRSRGGGPLVLLRGGSAGRVFRIRPATRSRPSAPMDGRCSSLAVPSVGVVRLIRFPIAMRKRAVGGPGRGDVLARLPDVRKRGLALAAAPGGGAGVITLETTGRLLLERAERWRRETIPRPAGQPDRRPATSRRGRRRTSTRTPAPSLSARSRAVAWGSPSSGR
jgi:hypothetical protein